MGGILGWKSLNIKSEYLHLKVFADQDIRKVLGQDWTIWRRGPLRPNIPNLQRKG